MSSEIEEKSNKRSAGNPADDIAQKPSTVTDTRTAKKIKMETKQPESEGRASSDQVGPSTSPSTSTGAHDVAGSFRVLQEDGTRWRCTLNQTKLEKNANKFYIMELLRNDENGNYTVRTRPARVGKNGKWLYPVKNDPNVSFAKKTFKEKFKQKTGNEWNKAENFTKIDSKYDLLDMHEDGRDCKPIKAGVEMHGDYEAPLGKLSGKQVDKGYSALKDIQALVKQGPAADNYAALLKSACNKFYTRIPQSLPTEAAGSLIDTMPKVEEKLELFVHHEME